ncbi:hypothetical protein TGME49_288060 [Toxoplasma gondii ME49]|uniref:Transmembrane protein n=1 Tax=Toxoplasma gondii (strain ATCC 50611 / Me49) TaxID=508771 RepID=S8F2Y3_TOXGM|nr:hypothetical protein TGME49_288060 [Toxoplasma gondii ME49]EPT27823.1 hypothetical protein TGME49_288060 [Toxoplasma gondii ME49]|eukprot:XP_018636346.1 hypothetical protein TGME49_288060 [Toxoplasma gondii ME49]
MLRRIEPAQRSAPTPARSLFLLLFCLVSSFLFPPISPDLSSSSTGQWRLTEEQLSVHSFTSALAVSRKRDFSGSRHDLSFCPYGGLSDYSLSPKPSREKSTAVSWTFSPVKFERCRFSFVNATGLGVTSPWCPPSLPETERIPSCFVPLSSSSSSLTHSDVSASHPLSSSVSSVSSVSLPSACSRLLFAALCPLLCSPFWPSRASTHWRMQRRRKSTLSPVAFLSTPGSLEFLRRLPSPSSSPLYSTSKSAPRSRLFFLPISLPLAAAPTNRPAGDPAVRASFPGVHAPRETGSPAASSRLHARHCPEGGETAWPASAAPPPGIRAPRWTVDTEGNFKILEQHGPPQDQRLVGWEDVLVEERRSWNATGKTEEQILRGEKTLTFAEKFQQRIFEARKIPHFQFVHHQPRGRPALWIVRPKQGAYCELMKDDNPRVHSLVSRIRRRFDRNALDIFNITLTADMPLCEVFFIGPIPELGRIFYARGGTLQYRVRPRFRTRCPTLAKDERLVQKYGGDGCPGLFPEWDEDGIIEELEECLNPPPPESESYPANLEWDNLAAFTPENAEERPHWYTHVHWPTRVAVQRAFEAGIADFREVIEKEYEQMLAEDRQRARRIRHQQDEEDRIRRGESHARN